MQRRSYTVWGIRVLRGGLPDVRQLPCCWTDIGVYAVMNRRRYWVRHDGDGMPVIDAKHPIPLPGEGEQIAA